MDDERPPSKAKPKGAKKRDAAKTQADAPAGQRGDGDVDARTKRIKTMSQYEHVIQRPTMYVGSTNADKRTQCALVTVRKTPSKAALAKTAAAAASAAHSTEDENAKMSDEDTVEPQCAPRDEGGSMQSTASVPNVEARLSEATYVPALLKIFDEVITNAADAAIEDPTVHHIAITCDASSFTIKNDGAGLPIEYHPDNPTLRLPELVFGHLMSSSNYYTEAEDDQRLAAGQNGLGVKLANIFCSSFTVRTCDALTGNTFQKTWTDRMSKSTPAKVSVRKPKASSGGSGGGGDGGGSDGDGDGEDGIEASGDEDDENAAKPKSKPKPKPKPAKKKAVGAHPFKGFVEVKCQPLTSLLAPHGAILGTDLEKLFAARALDVALSVFAGVRISFNGVTLRVPSLKAYMALFVPSESIVGTDEADPNWRVGVAVAPETSGGAVHALVNGVSASKGSHVFHVEYRLYDEVIKAAKEKRGLKDVSLKNSQLKQRTILFLSAKMSGVTFNSQTKEDCTGGHYLTVYAPQDTFVKKILASDIVCDAAHAEKRRAERELARKTDGKMTVRVSVPKLQDATLSGGDKSKQTALFLTEGDSARSFAIAGLASLGFDKYGVFPLRGKLLNVRDATAKELTDNEEIKHLKTILGLRENKTHANCEDLRYGRIICLTDSDADGSHIRGLILNFIMTKWPLLAKSGFVQVMQTPIVRATLAGRDIRDFYNLAEFNAWAASGASAGWRIKYYKGLGTWPQADARALLTVTPVVRLIDDEEADAAMELGFDKKKTDERKTWILNSIAAPPVPDYTRDMTISNFVHTDLINYSSYSVERALPSMLDGMKTSQRKIIFTVRQRNYVGAAREVKVAQLAGAVAELTLYLHGEKSLNDAIVNMAQDFVGANNLPLLYPDGAFGTRLANGKDAASPRYIFTYAQAVTNLLLRPEDDDLLTRKQEEGVNVEPVAFWPVLPLLLINGASAIATGFSTNVPMFSPADVKANVTRFLDDEDLRPMTPFFKGFTGDVVRAPGNDTKWIARGCATIDENDASRVHITELPPNTAFNKYEEWIVEDTKNKLPFTLVHNKSSDTTPEFLVKYKPGHAPPDDHDALLKELKLTENISTSNMYVFDANGSVKKYDDPLDLLSDWCAWRLDKYEARRTHLIEVLERKSALASNKARFVRAVTTKKLHLGDLSEAALCEQLQSKGFLMVEGGYDYLLTLGARSFTSDRAEALQKASEDAETEAQAMRDTNAKALWRADLKRLVQGLKQFRVSG
jgi:DNA topoisomerase-2